LSGSKLQLLSHITCDGNERYGVEKFFITSNQRVPNNRRNFISNRANIPVFSYLMIRYAGDDLDTVVKVMAIVRLKIIEDDWRTLGRVVLVVARMKCAAPSRSSSLPYETLTYSFDGLNNNMDFDVIELSSVRQPVCVIPQYSRIQTVHLIEKLADRIGKKSAKKLKFLLVPNNSMINDANIGLEHESGEVICDDVTEGDACSAEESWGEEDEYDSQGDDIQGNNGLVLNQESLDRINARVTDKELATDSDEQTIQSESDDGSL